MHWNAFTGILLAALLVCSNATALGQEKATSLDSDPHLVAWWTFDAIEGNQIKDQSGRGHHATLTGIGGDQELVVPGVIGKALCLPAPEAAAVAEGFKGILNGNARTISVWIKTKRSAGEIVSWGKRDFGRMWVMAFIRGHVGVTPRGGYYYMAARINDDSWHHVVAVLGEGNPPNLYNNAVLYLDGKQAEIDPIGLLDLWPIQTEAEQDVTIGKGFQGCLDDLRIYDRALTEEEVQDLFKLGRQ